MQKFKNVVNVLFVAISLSSRGSDQDNMFLYEKKCMSRRGRLVYKIIFQETIHFECGPLYLLFSLTHLLMFYAYSDPPFLSPSPLLSPYSTDEFCLTSLSLTCQLLLSLAYTITEELTD